MDDKGKHYLSHYDSKFNYGVGFSAYSDDFNLSIARRLPDNCSVYQAENLELLRL